MEIIMVSPLILLPFPYVTPVFLGHANKLNYKKQSCYVPIVCGLQEDGYVQDYSRWSQKQKSWPWKGSEAWASLGDCERYTLDASCGIHPAVRQHESEHKPE